MPVQAHPYPKLFLDLITNIQPQVYSGPFQARNTLSRDRTIPRIREQRDSNNQTTQVQRAPQLLIKTSRGRNIGPVNLTSEAESDSDSHSTKRRKIGHEIAFVAPLDSPLSTQALPLIETAPSDHNFHNKPKRFAGIEEFHTVESRMRSTPRRRQKTSKSEHCDNEMITVLLKTPRETVSEDVTRGQGSQEHNISPLRKSAVNDSSEIASGSGLSTSKSKYFAKLRGGTTSWRESIQTPKAKFNIDGAAGKIISIDIDQKCPHDASPDELCSQTTVGMRNGPLDQSPLKLSSLARLSEPESSSKLIETKLPPSSIRHTDFTAVESRKRKSNATKGKRSLELSGLSIPGRAEIYTGEGMILSYNSTNEVYEVYSSGKQLILNEKSYSFRTSKLRRVLRALNGRYLQFTSHRIEGVDDSLDIIATKESHVPGFLTQLKLSDSVKLEARPSQEVERIFQRRRNQILITKLPAEQRSFRSPSPLQSPRQLPVSKSARLQSLGGLSKQSSVLTSLLETHQEVDKVFNKSVRTKQEELSQQNMKRICTGKDPQPLEQNAHLNQRKSSRLSSRVSPRKFYGREASYLSNQPPVKAPSLGKSWQAPLIYPENGKKRAIVEFTDLERLEEGTFLNDGIVTFYMRYLEHELEQHNTHVYNDVYFFSTFFFERLKKAKRFEGINYVGVQSWTRNVDLFAYNFVVVPINENAHWYLAIICNLPAILTRDGSATEVENTENPVAARRDEHEGDRHDDAISMIEGDVQNARSSFADLDINEVPSPRPVFVEPGTRSKQSKSAVDGGSDPIVDSALESSQSSVRRKKAKRKSHPPPQTRLDPTAPIILILDSLGGTHSRTIRHLKDYLFEEGRTKRGGVEYDVENIKGVNAKAIPQQDNFSDCGLYMLGYLERFLQDPALFVARVIRREIQDDWTIIDASLMRRDIRRQLLSLGARQEAANSEGRKETGEPEEPSSPVQASDLPFQESSDDDMDMANPREGSVEIQPATHSSPPHNSMPDQDPQDIGKNSTDLDTSLAMLSAPSQAHTELSDDQSQSMPELATLLRQAPQAHLTTDLHDSIDNEPSPHPKTPPRSEDLAEVPNSKTKLHSSPPAIGSSQSKGLGGILEMFKLKQKPALGIKEVKLDTPVTENQGRDCAPRRDATSSPSPALPKANSALVPEIINVDG